VTPTSVTPTPVTPTAVDLPAAQEPYETGWNSPVRGGRPWRRRPAVLFGMVGCLLVLAVVAAFAGVGRRAEPAVVASAPPTPGTSALPPALAAPPGPAESPPAESRPPEPQPAQLEEAVRTYYGLLPGDTTAGWQYLGTAERAKTRGLASYNQFWSEIDQVSIVGPVTVAGNTVLVNLQFEPKNRKPTFERYRLTMGTAPDGRVLIESASRIGTFALARR
jgi:hypothetical protein